MFCCNGDHRFTHYRFNLFADASVIPDSTCTNRTLRMRARLTDFHSDVIVLGGDGHALLSHSNSLGNELSHACGWLSQIKGQIYSNRWNEYEEIQVMVYRWHQSNVCWEKFLVLYLICCSFFAFGQTVYGFATRQADTAAISLVLGAVMLALPALYINSAPVRKVRREATALKLRETAKADASKHEEAKLNKKDPTALQKLTDLSALHETGELSDEEFAVKKTELLCKI